MARKYKATRLLVALNGRLVGRLERAAGGATSFTYDAAWLEHPSGAIPISLSMPLSEGQYSGAEVLSFFDNLLPDNDAIRRRIAVKVGAEGTGAFSLLERIGRDCVGALQFAPEDFELAPPGQPQGTPLKESEVAAVIRNLALTPLGISIKDGYEFRISIAGAQEKTALLWDNGWQRPQGATPTTHILKPSLGKLPNGLDMRRSVENEHFCLTLCRELGLVVAASQIVDFEDQRVLVVERFDRTRNTDGRLLRLPQEDFCQALSVSSSQKYNSEGGPGMKDCLALLNGSDYAEEDRLAFIRAQIVFWLIGATDGHAKNFSIFLSKGGSFRMTPLYDVMSVQPNFAAGQLQQRELRLAMAVGDSRHYQMETIMPGHFLQMAKAAGIDEGQVSALFAELKKEIEAAADRAIKAMPSGFPMKIADSITTTMRKRANKAIK